MNTNQTAMQSTEIRIAELKLEEDETFDELLHRANDAREQLSNVLSSVDCAASCETLADYTANISEALEYAQALAIMLRKAKLSANRATVDLGKRKALEAK